MWSWIGALVVLAIAAPLEEPKARHDWASLPVRPLRSSGTPTMTSQPLAAFYGSPICQEGGVYLRPLSPPTAPQQSPVVRLDPKVTTTVTFDLRKVPHLADGEFVAPSFAVDSFGKVYYLIRRINPANPRNEALFLVSFSSDGTFSSRVELEVNLWPQAFEVFPSGMFLVAGINRAPYDRAEKENPSPIAAIFRSDGRLQRYLLRPQEDGGQQKTAALQFVTSVMGPDGFVYVLVDASEPRVEVWSESGERVRTVKLASPLKESHAQGLMVSGGAIAVQMHGPKAEDPETRAPYWPVVIGVYDATTGEPRSFYDGNSIKGRPVCFDRDRFLFLVPELQSMGLVSVPIE